ncbi:hypothetical protein [Coleofasciculus sp. FACHB-SPT9]|uniref:hypothetical protein n=1 Tax=Cyanophyceae TaxID=3028117 RepID=UPI001682E1E0|nr:hypothetical protein [Coleofasciculus sp. FACHB-SPT9]MBD1887944.1 hypothetical protein [Coleofasciculus sp. FACHB-SPT9]
MSNDLIRNLLWNTTPRFGLREAVDIPMLNLRGWIMGVAVREDGWAYQINSEDRPPVWLPESDLQKIPLSREELHDDF